MKQYILNKRYDVMVCNDGTVYNLDGTPVKIWYNTKTRHGRPYQCTTLFDKLTGKYERVFIHRIVAFCWCKGYEKGKVVDHIDNDRNNNHPSNLRWVTQEENIRAYYREQRKAAS